MPKSIPVQRLKLIGTLYSLYLGFSLLTRVILGIWSASDSSLNLKSASEIFLIGFIYDSAFFFYLIPFMLIWIIFMPSRWWNSRIVGNLIRIGILGFIISIMFILSAELLFWEEFHCRFNFIAVDYLIYTKEVIGNIWQSYPIVQIGLWISIAAFALTIIINRNTSGFYESPSSFRMRLSLFTPLLILPLLGYLIVDQKLKQIGDNAFQNELCGNGPYQFVASFRNNEMDYAKFYPTMDLSRAASVVRPLIQKEHASFIKGDPNDVMQAVQFDGHQKPLNLVLIQIESMSSDFMGVFGNTHKLTPFLDQLANESLFFTNCYATGTRTTRGLEAVSLSLPPMPGRSIVKRIGRESGMLTLGGVMKRHGYTSRFVYGGRGFFDNMNAFFGGNGYEITDQHSTPAHEIGFSTAWGMADEYLFKQAIKVANSDSKSGKLFFQHIMTTSNHRPYTYPAGRIDIPSGSGREGAVKYTDWAIQDYFQKARKQLWFDQTLFVIVADHQASSAGKVTLPLERYHIPLMFYAPGLIKPQKIDSVCSQIDVPTTIFAMLNMNYEGAFFGQNMLSKSFQPRAFIGTYQALGCYNGLDLYVMRPLQAPEVHHQAGTSQMTISHQNLDPLELEKCQAFYQMSDHTYQNGLNKLARLDMKIN